MKVYQAINRVQASLAKSGIGKDRKNVQQGYAFRGIDDVYNVLSPLLAENGLCILPRMIARTCEERQTAKGGTLFYVTVEAEFDMVCAEDGSKHTVRTFGEAMDSGDKATNKAMSAAYKYAAFQAFAIPTEGDNDADAHTHEAVRPKMQHRPVDGAVVSQERMTVIAAVADAIKEQMAREDILGAYEEATGITDPEEKTALWAMLDSKTRSEIKKVSDQLKEKA